MVQKEPGKRRGRPPAYDPQRALQQATRAFWQAGYTGTSLDVLSAATGMNRPSLYGAFGDKHALYLTTLDIYILEGSKAMSAALSAELPLSEALMRMYDSALSLYVPDKGAAQGCFLIGTAAVEAMSDPEIRTRLASGLQKFDKLLEARLRLAQQQAELDTDADVQLLARIASAGLHTLAIRSRAGDSRASLRKTAQGLVQLICAARNTTRKA